MFILLLNIAFALDCTDVNSVKTKEESVYINTDIPKYLKDAVIIVRTKDGRESHVSANRFKVVPRKQQRLVTKIENHTERTCTSIKNEKNMVLIGARKDHTNLSIESNGKLASVKSEKNIILDVSYIRQNLLGTPVGAGAGVDTNGTLKGLIGVEF